LALPSYLPSLPSKKLACKYTSIALHSDWCSFEVEIIFHLPSEPWLPKVNVVFGFGKDFVNLLSLKLIWFRIMPKIFEYLGILVFFYSNEHEPIHVHGKKGEFESKAEFYIIDGEISEIRITNISGAKPLKGQNLKDFQTFLEIYADNIVEKWINYFVYHKDVAFEKITKRIK
jgi:hypothetical protein